MVPEMAGDTAKTRTPFRGFYEIRDATAAADMIADAKYYR